MMERVSCIWWGPFIRRPRWPGCCFGLWILSRGGGDMFVVFSADGVPWYRTSDEVEADYLAFCVGGFVVESGAY